MKVTIETVKNGVIVNPEPPRVGECVAKNEVVVFETFKGLTKYLQEYVDKYVGVTMKTGTEG